MEYYAEHQPAHGSIPSRFLIWSNERRRKLPPAGGPTADPSPDRWQEIIAHRSDTLIESVEAFRDFLLVHERRDGLPHFRLSAPDGRSGVRPIAFPEPVYTASLSDSTKRLPRSNQPGLRPPTTCASSTVRRHAHSTVEVERWASRRLERPQAAAHPQRLRSVAVRTRRTGRHCARRHAVPMLGGLSQGHAARREQPAAPLRLRLLRLQHGGGLPHRSAQPARSRGDLRAGARARRQRTGPRLVRAGAAAPQAQLVYGPDRLRRGTDRGGLHHAGSGWRSAAAAPAGCW